MTNNLINNFPEEMKKYNQWVLWRKVWKPEKEKYTKIPVGTNGKNASTTNPSTWSSFEEVTRILAQGEISPTNETYKDIKMKVDGIGFVFTENDPFCGIDFDGYRDPGTNEIEEPARQYIERFNSWTEISQSGKGLHVIVKAQKPSDKRCKDDKIGIEIYDHARFFALTGNTLPGYPCTIESRQDELTSMYQEIFPENKEDEAKCIKQIHTTPTLPNSLDDKELVDKAMNNDKTGRAFTSLWNGDITGYPSQSEADMALCDYLAFWTSRDQYRIDNLFRQSGLYRKKWDEKHGAKTYGQITVEKALTSVQEGYENRAIDQNQQKLEFIKSSGKFSPEDIEEFQKMYASEDPLEKFSQSIELPVKRVFQYGRTQDSEYVMELKNGRNVRLGTAKSLYSFKSIEAKILSQVQHSIPYYTNAKWRRVLEILFKPQVVVEVVNMEDIIMDQLCEYLKYRDPINWEDPFSKRDNKKDEKWIIENIFDSNRAPFPLYWESNGSIAIILNEFFQRVFVGNEKKYDKDEIIKRLRLEGFETCVIQKTFQGKKYQRRYYKSKPGMLQRLKEEYLLDTELW